MRTRASRPDRYRQEADRLRREALAVQVPEARAELLSLARQYDALARQVELISDHFSHTVTRLRHRS